jgi:hypothetical protein
MKVNFNIGHGVGPSCTNWNLEMKSITARQVEKDSSISGTITRVDWDGINGWKVDRARGRSVCHRLVFMTSSRLLGGSGFFDR